jgi:hypothetical protein
MTKTPPTQHLGPPKFSDWTASGAIEDILSDLEDSGVILKEHTLSKLRVKVQNRMKQFDFTSSDLGKIPPRDLIDSIIKQRLEAAT